MRQNNEIQPMPMEIMGFQEYLAENKKHLLSSHYFENGSVKYSKIT